MLGLILLYPVVFAAAIFTNKLVLLTFTPTFFVGLRMLISGVLLGIYCWSRNILHVKNFLRDWKKIGLIAFFTALLPSIFKAYALAHLPASQAALLGSIDPFVTALYAYMLWGEKLSLTKTLGIFVGLTGALLPLNLQTLSLSACVHTSTLLPQIAAIMAVFLGRWGWIMVRNLLRAEQYAVPELNAYVMTISGVTGLLGACMAGNIFVSTINIARSGFAPNMLSLDMLIVLLVFTIIVGNMGGYTLYGYIVKHANITLVSLTGTSIPLMVGFYDWLFMGQSITFSMIIAVALVFAGVLIFYYNDLRQTISKSVN